MLGVYGESAPAADSVKTCRLSEYRPLNYASQKMAVVFLHTFHLFPPATLTAVAEGTLDFRLELKIRQIRLISE